MRWFDTECIVKRNTKSIGQYNRPSFSLQEVGKYKVGMDTKNGYVHQQNPQAVKTETTVFYFPTYADIKPKDIFVVNGVNYICGNPTTYRTHLEVLCTLSEEI